MVVKRRSVSKRKIKKRGESPPILEEINKVLRKDPFLDEKYTLEQLCSYKYLTPSKSKKYTIDDLVKEYKRVNNLIIGPFVNLEDADLFRANLSKSNLTGANLTKANLQFANLSGAN